MYHSMSVSKSCLCSFLCHSYIALQINPWRACTARVTLVVLCVCVSVCLSVKSHLTSEASVHPENTAICIQRVMEVKRFVGFSLTEDCYVVEIQHCSIESIRTVGHFPVECAHAHYFDSACIFKGLHTRGTEGYLYAYGWRRPAH